MINLLLCELDQAPIYVLETFPDVSTAVLKSHEAEGLLFDLRNFCYIISG